jgi:hypothetical protein
MAIKSRSTTKKPSVAVAQEDRKWVLYDSCNNKIYFFSSLSEAEAHVNDEGEGVVGYLLFEAASVLVPEQRHVSFNKVSFKDAEKYTDNIMLSV